MASLCGEQTECLLLLNYVCPAVGALATAILFTSPMPVIWRLQRQLFDDDDDVVDALSVRKEVPGTPSLSTRRTLNAFPHVMMVSNTLVRMLYAILIKNYFLFLPNMYGLLVSLWYVLTCFCHLARTAACNKHVPVIEIYSSAEGFLLESKGRPFHARSSFFGLLILLLSCWTFIVTITFITMVPLSRQPPQVAQLLLGSASVVILAAFYVSPLSDLYRVVQTRNASLFYWPMSVTAFVNGVLWTVYGLVLSDPFLWAPNFVGAVVGFIQLALIFSLKPNPTKPALTSDPEL